MYLDSEQQAFLTQNYEGVHLREGRTLDAANQAADRLREIDTRAFTDVSLANWHGELYFQAVTLLNSAAKRGATYSESARILEQSAVLQLAHGPIARTPDEARKRLEYFSSVFNGTTDASVRAYREFLNLVDFLSILDTSTHSKEQLRQIVKQILSDLQVRTGDSGIYILRVERDPLKSATTAFIEYLIDYLQRRSNNPDELKAVARKYLQRLIPNSPGTSIPVTHQHLAELVQHKDPTEELNTAIVQEILQIRYIGIQREIVQLSPSRS